MKTTKIEFSTSFADLSNGEMAFELASKEANFGVKVSENEKFAEVEIGNVVKFTNLQDKVEEEILAKAEKIEEANKIADQDRGTMYANIHTNDFSSSESIISFKPLTIESITTETKGTSWLAIIAYVLAALGAVYVAYSYYNVNLEVSKK